MPDARTAATRIHRFVLITFLEILAAHEVFQHTRPDELVESDTPNRPPNTSVK
jgi:hypothetical protein